MPKTRAEQYDLYEDVDINGPTPHNPQIRLQPNTEVDIIQEKAAWSKVYYHYVEVQQAPNKGTLGYLPKFALLDCDVLQKKVGLTTVETTGQTYGAGGVPKGDPNQASFVARGRGLHFQLPFQGKEGCPYCGGTADAHTIQESKEAKEAAKQVHDAIFGLKSAVGGMFMIGVLKVVGGEGTKSYLAVSDGYTKERESDLETIASRLKLSFVDRQQVKSWDYLRDFTGKKITEIGEARINITRMYKDYLQCAGPKLLQRLVQAYQTDDITFKGTLFMSEIWFEPRRRHETYSDKSSAESCDKCAVLIPRMLCGYKPPK